MSNTPLTLKRTQELSPEQNWKECEFCGAVILKRAKKCPTCKKALYNGVYKDPPQHIERNKKMTQLLEAEGATLASVGKQFFLTRERVRQLYRITTGHSYKTALIKKQQARQQERDAKKKERDKIIKFYCDRCKKPVLYGDGYWLHKFCRECSTIRKGRTYKETIACRNCGKPFHPWRSLSNMIYCSRPCYGAYRRAHWGDEPHTTAHIVRTLHPPSSYRSVLRINGKEVRYL